MTRETKIGLLVGLAFIIMIGVLLSEHVSSTNAPPHSLVGVADNVRNGNGLPAAPAPAAPISLNASNPAPTGPVPTPNELNTPSGPGIAMVNVNPPASSQTPLVIEQARDNSTTLTPVNAGNNAAPIVALTRQNDADIHAAIDFNAGNHPTTLPAPQNSKPAVATRDYKAESGDTLSKIASKIYGKNTKTLRDGIVAANATLKGNPDKIIVGHTYQIPLLNQPSIASIPNTVPASNNVANLVSPTTRPAAREAAVAQATRTCTAREGDTLWKIATRELGNGANWQQIADLNHDVLKGSTNLKPGMTLKLPVNKTLAMAR